VTLKAENDMPSSEINRRERHAPRSCHNWWLYFVVVLLTSLSIFTAVLLLWMRKGIEQLISARSRELPIVVVLKDEIGEASARRLAERLEKENAACEITLLGRAEAKAMLSIHEPWFKEFQDVSLVHLPCLIEIRDPALLGQYPNIEKRLAQLQRQPEVEFVIFNSVGLDDVVRFVGALRRHANILVVTILATLFIFNAVFWGLSSWVAGWRGLQSATFRTLVVVCCAAVFAALWWQLVLKIGLQGVPTLTGPPLLYFALVSVWLGIIYFAVACAMSLLASLRQPWGSENA